MTSTLAPAAVARPLLRLLVVAAMTLPMLILYAVGVLGPSLQRDLGIGLAAVGLLPMSCFGLAALLSLGAGQVVVRLGSQRALALLFASVALAYALLAGLPGLGGVIAAIAVCGLAQALANPVTNLLIAEQVPPAERAGVVGLKQSGVQLAALLAGLLLPTLSLWLGWRGALAGLALPALLLAAAALATLPPATAAGQPWRWLAPNRPLRLLMGVQLCAGIGLSAFVTYLPTFAAGRGMAPQSAGALLAAFGLAGMISRIVLTPLAARSRAEARLLFGLLLAAALAVLLLRQMAAGESWRPWTAAVGMGLSAVATNAIAMGLLLRSPAFGPTAIASGQLSAAFFGGFALGPLGFGAIAAAAGGFAAAWQALTAVLLAGAALAAWLARQRPEQP